MRTRNAADAQVERFESTRHAELARAAQNPGAVERVNNDLAGYGGATMTSGTRTAAPTRTPLSVRSDQSLTDWAVRAGVLPRSEQPSLDFGAILRGLATNQWDGAEVEHRALSESPTTAGGHMVPTPVALSVIDKARNVARVVQAGATVVPMTSQTLKYPRLTSEGTPAWRSEAGAIADTSMVFDAVTLTAQSLAILIKMSWELLVSRNPC